MAALEAPHDIAAPRGFRKVSHCIKGILKEDGIKGFYRGFGTSLVESFTNVIYLMAQRALAHHFVSDAEEEVSIFDNVKEVFKERTVGSVLTAFMSVTDTGRDIRKRIKIIIFKSLRRLGNLAMIYPLRVLQRRFIMHKGALRVKGATASDLIREIWRKEGILGFYSGLSMQIGLDIATALASIPADRAISALLPESIKEMAVVGDVNEAVENKLIEIRDTAVDQAVKIKDIAESTIIPGK
jgi:hypothetical protein